MQICCRWHTRGPTGVQSCFRTTAAELGGLRPCVAGKARLLSSATLADDGQPPSQSQGWPSGFQSLVHLLIRCTSHLLLPLLRLLLPLNCFLSHFPLCKSAGGSVITIRLVFCSAVYILQHVKQDTTHSKCIVRNGFGEGTEWKGIREGRTLCLRVRVRLHGSVGTGLPQEGWLPLPPRLSVGIQGT